ncbi:MAG: formate-dependent phosphoribosylglycinamide formyltransferase [Bdellovibrionales bacterium]|nr:formate-dependent phosphoribosylglycinamide formyltransferase [Bdellovibrionales bacterium]
MKKILLLGSGELGKEFTIACKRLGQYVIAVDRYENAPAMQVADQSEVIDMLKAEDLDRLVQKHKPNLIVPEIEAIRTEKLFDFEKKNIQVVPSAKAANATMNRKTIRDLVAKDLKIKTANYAYASSLEQLHTVVDRIGIPCVIKPLMSSSGKGQSYVRSVQDVEKAWEYAISGSRGDLVEVIVEEFIDFEFEITLLTVTQKNGPTLFCAPIGHRQERGDYQESWQPMPMDAKLLEKAKVMAQVVTQNLGGAGLWGVEFFIGKNEVWFSELSPRPHDTGMVTLAQTQNFNEFELHARAVLGLSIPEIELLRSGASAVILANQNGENPTYTNIEEVCKIPKTDFRIFGKTTTRPYRRMGVVLGYDRLDCNIEELVDRVKDCAANIKIQVQA